jgi:hypothetical protein
VGFEFLVWVVLELLVVSVAGACAQRHQLVLVAIESMGAAPNMKLRAARWMRRAAGPPRQST